MCGTSFWYIVCVSTRDLHVFVCSTPETRILWISNHLFCLRIYIFTYLRRIHDNIFRYTRYQNPFISSFTETPLPLLTVTHFSLFLIAAKLLVIYKGLTWFFLSRIRWSISCFSRRRSRLDPRVMTTYYTPNLICSIVHTSRNTVLTRSRTRIVSR